jgi:hypothetical protein
MRSEQSRKHGLIAGPGHMGPTTHVADVSSRFGQRIGVLAAPEVSVAALRSAAWKRWCEQYAGIADRSLKPRAAQA